MLGQFYRKIRITMKKALLLHHSQTGNTAAFSNEIASFLDRRGFSTKVMPMYQATSAPISASDIIFMGCWTSGLFFFLQKPEKFWVEKVRELGDLRNKDIVLFTTYKILTGSMFNEMAKYLPPTARISPVRIKSRNGRLSARNRKQLEILMENDPAGVELPAGKLL
jgi:hypothetical protein